MDSRSPCRGEVEQGRGGQQEGSGLWAQRGTPMRCSILQYSCLGTKDPLLAPSIPGAARSTWSFPSASAEESGRLVSELLHMYTHIARKLGNAQEDMYTLSSATPLFPIQRDPRTLLQQKKEATGPSSTFVSLLELREVPRRLRKCRLSIPGVTLHLPS